MVKTKIIATLGPASRTETVIRKMMLAGMDVARLNFSHGSHAAHKERINIIRQLNKKYRRHIRILQDLEGPRIRVGRFRGRNHILLKKKHTIWLTQENILGDANLIPFDYKGSLGDIKRNQYIYIDDGNIALQVKSLKGSKLKAEVVVGGLLKENKGINIPGAHLKFEGLSLKDKEDIKFGIENKVDYIAQSFVRFAKDILKIRSLIKGKLIPCKLIAKIENREGIKNIDGIIEASDGIMVARGDMGVSLPIYEIPVIQKYIIKECNKRGKFVITATQMLESMTEHFRPTRAEVTDVANAILDGTDFLMLSAESATGKYPIGAVDMMNRIIKFTEGSKFYRQKKQNRHIE